MKNLFLLSLILFSATMLNAITTQTCLDSEGSDSCGGVTCPAEASEFAKMISNPTCSADGDIWKKLACRYLLFYLCGNKNDKKDFCKNGFNKTLCGAASIFACFLASDVDANGMSCSDMVDFMLAGACEPYFDTAPMDPSNPAWCQKEFPKPKPRKKILPENVGTN